MKQVFVPIFLKPFSHMDSNRSAKNIIRSFSAFVCLHTAHSSSCVVLVTLVGTCGRCNRLQCAAAGVLLYNRLKMSGRPMVLLPQCKYRIN